MQCLWEAEERPFVPTSRAPSAAAGLNAPLVRRPGPALKAGAGLPWLVPPVGRARLRGAPGRHPRMFLYWRKRGAYELEALPAGLAGLEYGAVERFSWSSSLDISEELGGRWLGGPGGWRAAGSRAWLKTSSPGNEGEGGQEKLRPARGCSGDAAGMLQVQPGSAQQTTLCCRHRSLPAQAPARCRGVLWCKDGPVSNSLAITGRAGHGNTAGSRRRRRRWLTGRGASGDRIPPPAPKVSGEDPDTLLPPPEAGAPLCAPRDARPTAGVSVGAEPGSSGCAGGCGVGLVPGTASCSGRPRVFGEFGKLSPGCVKEFLVCFRYYSR